MRSLPASEAAGPSRSSTRGAGWGCETPGLGARLAPRESRFSWLHPGPLIESRNDLLARRFGDPTDAQRREWLRRLDEYARAAGAPLPPRDRLITRFADRERVSVAVLGDPGEGDASQYVVVPVLDRVARDTDFAVLCSDVVYPAGGVRAYADRFYRPYADYPGPIYALPGNHDWYDGLTSFLRVFAQRRPFGGWNTEQTRSYFAVRLPQRWWLYAIDTQFDDYVDAPQLEYFRAASEQLREGDAVILCTSTPAWVDAGCGGRSKGYDTIEFFQREVIRPRGASVRVMLTGDKHHYARYAQRDGTGQKITSGLGGAYLASTHRLPERLDLPGEKSRVRDPLPPSTFDLTTRYPEPSAKLSAGILKLPWRNPGFWGLTGIAQLVATATILYGIAESAVRDGVFGLLASWSPAVLAAVVLVLAGVAFARIELPTTSRSNVVAGVAHAVAHLALSVAWALTIRALFHAFPDGAVADWLIFLVVAVGTPVVIGFVDAEVVALYLLVASRFGINLNEVMAGQSIEDHKGFLRMHIAADGVLTIYPVKLERVCRRWTADPDGAPADPWLRPAEPLEVALIEEPIKVPHH